ncbi:hypothetical protein [Paradevosia shaoguanensis]|uniref:hypothetical protein n=1 Tax=Paradevosia shaoguanensis TaxID=1335043 RepID=UPI0019323696|nr:hypothetical protein [Paradevosia shaoguanensis]
MNLTYAQYDFLEALENGWRLKPADDAEDRVRQFCRKNGLAEVLAKPRRWSITPVGRAALQAARSKE